MKKIFFKTICILLTINSAIAQSSLIQILPAPKHVQLQMPWRNCITVGRANNLLRADILEHLEYAQKIMGYRYCRFHAIFDDEMDVVRRDKNTGELIFNWHQVDKVYDALLSMGIRPFVELNPMPKVLASGTQTMFNYKMNVTKPQSYNEWANLVENFVRHLVQRYSLQEVRTWYFEVWNEPNLSAFWAATQQDYWQLYSASAFAVKKVDLQLRVGGPATASGAWIKDIIDYCEKENVPLDFVSTHLYPQDEQVFYPNRKNSPFKVGEYFGARFKEVQAIVRSSKKPNLEIHWTEWNTQSAASAENVTWGENIYVDNLFAASFIARNMIELDTMANSMAYWVVSDIFDEGGIPQSPFSNTYGMMTIHGIPKASFNAFRFLRKMTGELMDVTTTQPLPNGKGIVATIEGQTIHVLLWNQNFVEEKTHSSWSALLQLPAYNDSAQTMVKATIGIGGGSAWESWQLMGRPLNPSSAQLELLKQHAEPSYSMAFLKPMNKNIQISFNLKPGEVQYIEITPKGQSAITRFVNPEDFKIWDDGMSERKNLKEKQIAELQFVSLHPTPIISKGSKGTEDNKFGFEGGTCQKVNGKYYLFTTEIFDTPKTAATRLVIWKSNDGLKFEKKDIIVETNTNWNDTTHNMSPWSPMVVFDDQRNVWSVFHVGYRRKPTSSNVYNMSGRIFRYDSKVKGINGIIGPYQKGGWLKIDKKPDWWEGSGEIVSFYPYQVNKDWWAFYGGNSVPEHVDAKDTSNPNQKNIFYAGLMKSENGLTDKWVRQSHLNPVQMNPEFVENSVVTKVASNLYINLYDGSNTNAISYACSKDGIHWGKEQLIEIPNSPKLLKHARTPLCLINEGNGIYTIYFTAFDGNNSDKVEPLWHDGYGNVWKMQVRLKQ